MLLCFLCNKIWPLFHSDLIIVSFNFHLIDLPHKCYIQLIDIGILVKCWVYFVNILEDLILAVHWLVMFI